MVRKSADDVVTGLDLVNTFVDTAERSMASMISRWNAARLAYQAQGYVDDSEKAVVKMNALLPTLEHTLPIVVSALLPGRPYMPLGARREKDPVASKIAKLKTRLVDATLGASNFYAAFTEWARLAAVYNSAFIEPEWSAWMTNVSQMYVDVDPVTGQVRDVQRIRGQEMRDELRFKVHEPWALLCHPAGQTLDAKPWIAIREIVPYDEIERRLDEKDSGWKLPDDMTLSDLKTGPMRLGQERMTDQWRRDLGVFSQEARNDVAVLVRYYSAKRWVTVVNYMAAVVDGPNGNVNMPLRQKPVVQFRWHESVGPDRFWGVSEWERIQDVATLDDTMMSIYVDHALANNSSALLYNENLVDRESLSGEYGAEIRVRNYTGRLEDAFQYLVRPPLDRSFLDLHSIMEREKQDRMSFQDIQRGVAPSPRQTADATRTLSANAGRPAGFLAKYHETTTMAELTYLTCKVVSANMSPVQMMDYGGLSFNEMLAVIDADPENIPGGFKYEFDGSDRLSRRAERYERLMQGFNLTANMPVIANGPGINIQIKKILEGTESYDDDELEAMIPKEMLAAQVPAQVPAAGALSAGADRMESIGSAGQALMPPGQMPTPASNEAAVVGE